MNLRDEWIESGQHELQLLDGRVLEVFRDRRVNQSHARVGYEARRRKPPAVMEAHIGTGRVWVARGWAAVNAREAARFPKTNQMIFRPIEFGDWYITSLRANHELAVTLDFEDALVFDFHALLVPSAMQVVRLKRMGLVNLKVPAHRESSDPIQERQVVLRR